MGWKRQLILQWINEIIFTGNNRGMYSTLNEGKFVTVERFIKTLKNEIYKYMTSISKNVCIG